MAGERVQCDGAGQVVLQLKTVWHDEATRIAMSPLEFMQRRLAVLVLRPRIPVPGLFPRCTPRTTEKLKPVLTQSRP